MHGALPTARSNAREKVAIPRVKLPVFYYALTAFVLFLAWIRHSTADHGDPFRCHAVLTDGQWIDPPETPRRGSPEPFQKWQPRGCMLRPYNSKNIATCLESGAGNDAIFIGDSTVREVFWAMARKLDKTAADTQSSQVTEKHADVRFISGTVALDFIWDPFLNSTQLLQVLDASRSNAANPKRIALPNSRALVVVGGGLWYARLEGGVAQFAHAMDKLADPAHQQHHFDIVDNPGANRVFIMPVQPPFYQSLDPEHAASLKKADVDAMNANLVQLQDQYEVDILFSFLKMEASAPAYQANGLHVTHTVADRQAEIILNARCNNKDQSYPYVGTCCYDYPAPTAQVIFIFFGFVGLALMLFLEGSGRFYHSIFDARLEPVKRQLPVLRPLMVMFAALFYCYLADRTHLFDKVMKQYNNSDFFVFCLAIALVGGLTIKKSAPPRTQEKPAVADQPFLSRDQTDEWKGWMQLMILAYHYVGASKVLWIYKLIRLMVASYLFMSGYGHAAYFYQKKDFSLKRVVAVNIRLNLLSCMLPWIMDSDYLFYYFAPLVTYWYAVIYITMRVKSDWNTNFPFFILKICIAATTTTFLHTQPWLLEPGFAIINTIFRSKWDAKEWLFRCALDQFIVYVGMVVAVIYIRSSHPPPPPPPPQDPIASTSHTKPGSPLSLKQAHLFALDGIAILIYLVGTATRTTKSSSNQLHTFVSPLAILAFIHLRNATPLLRNHYSGAYAWIGKISLETFVLQYHIWLASDTRGLLSLGVFGSGEMGSWGMGTARWLDCILCGIVFVWISSKVAAATGGVTAGLMKIIFR